MDKVDLRSLIITDLATKFVVGVVFSLKWSESHSVVPNSLQPQRLHSPWNSPGQNTGVGSLSLLQGIFPTQGSNPDLPHCRWTLLPAEPQRKLCSHCVTNIILSNLGNINEIRFNLYLCSANPNLYLPLYKH